MSAASGRRGLAPRGAHGVQELGPEARSWARELRKPQLPAESVQDSTHGGQEKTWGVPLGIRISES